MEGEINNLVMVWSLIFISMNYCFAIAKIIPKGKNRLIAFLPVVCLFLILPLNLNTFHLKSPTALFITWFANFKLLLLAFGNGPLSDPSLSLGQFVAISSLPILVSQNLGSKEGRGGSSSDNDTLSCTFKMKRVQKKGSSKQRRQKPMGIGLQSSLHYAKKALILAFVLFLTPYKDYFPKNVFSFFICIQVAASLELMLGLTAMIGQVLIGTELERPFNDPHLSASLQDFWGRRWNRVASSILRASIFKPIKSYTSRAFGRTWAFIWASLGTFLVSGLMHELILCYIGGMKPRWETTLYFMFQGLCSVVESMVKKKVDAKWKLPQKITGPFIFGLVIITFMMFVPIELLHHDFYGRALEEYQAMGVLVNDFGLACIDRVLA